MNERIKSLIFAIFGLVILAFAIITDAGMEVITFSSLLIACAVALIIFDHLK